MPGSGSGVSGVSGTAVAAAAAGALLLWSGLKGANVSQSLRSLLSGTKPAAVNANPVPAASSVFGTAAATVPVTGTQAAPGDTGAHSASATANQAIARLIAAPYGWSTGQQWADLVSLWNRESGWNNTIANQTSGALGIAQALGHGTATSAGTLGNEYPSKAANDGNAAAQITWGLSYIKSAYGSPSAAWAHEEANGWY